MGYALLSIQDTVFTRNFSMPFQTQFSLKLGVFRGILEEQP